MLKEAGLQFISIFGEHHYTFNPEEIYRDKNIDVICRGEGETAFRSFIRAIRDEKEYRHTEKLWVHFGDEVIENPIGKVITDLDSIPFPDRDLIPIYDEGEQIFGNSVSVMFTRGCPNQCTYCYNSK